MPGTCLRLLQEDRFPAVWQPSVENEQPRQLLLHRCRLVRLRTRITNQLDSMGKNEGLLGSKSWSASYGGASRRCRCLAGTCKGESTCWICWTSWRSGSSRWRRQWLKRRRNHQQACLLTTHPGVGPIVSLVYVLTIGDWTRFARSRELASYLGLIPAEDSSADKRRLGHISKQGNTLLRWLLVQAAMGAQRSDPSWHRGIFSFVAEQASRRRQGGHRP